MNTKLILMIAGGVLLLAATGLLVARVATRETLIPAEAMPAEVVRAFKLFKRNYGKVYGDVDIEVYKLNVFYKNYQKVQAATGKKFTLALNKFADLTTDEFKSMYLGLKGKKPAAKNVHTVTGSAPSSIDWTAKGDVTKIKDQGQCGSCWAFSTTGSVESATKIQLGDLPSLSEQQLVDCSGSYGNMGCNGGLMDYAFEYIEANGITTEADYPYKAVDQKCKTDGGKYKISTYTDVSSGSCSDLEDAIGTKQPVSIGVDAESWQFYSGGVFDDCGTQLDHGVLATGYTDLSSDGGYWEVKNSWGQDWGMSGYIRLAPGNTCGICNTASYPTASQ